ncbi:Uncharacterized protein SCF082_LOCUS47777 [Durusdinium trenchii]|uniref:Reverse transcriptase domain-containing protein n=1 Tax=Durusdinium trenchii TaxID=1381693 RepID=A0ABP0RRX3_9DINO
MCARLLLRCTFCLVAVGYPGPAIVTAWSAPDGPAPRADAGRVGCIGRRERKRLTALLHSLSASPAPPKPSLRRRDRSLSQDAMVVDGVGAAGRLYCPVSGCPCSDTTRAKGWTSKQTLIAHVDSHLAGTLRGQVIGIHTVRAWTQRNGAAANKVLLKLDFANAFNRISRHHVLESATVQFSGLARWVTWCYQEPSALRFGTAVISLQPDFEFLGGAIGGDAFVDAHTKGRVEAVGPSLDALAALGDAQVGLRLLRSCAGYGRLVHSMRCNPPHCQNEALQLFDLKIQAAFSSITGLHLTAMQRAQVGRGLAFAGAGVRSSSLDAPAAFLASVGGCASACEEVDVDPACTQATAALNANLLHPLATADSWCPQCNGILDRLSLHAGTCVAGGEKTLRHTAVRDALCKWADRAGLQPEKERPGLLLPQRPGDVGTQNRRPADIFLPSLHGSPAALDLANGPPAGTGRGSSIGSSVQFVPLVAESTGAWERAASQLLLQIACSAAARTGDDSATLHSDLLQELSVIIRSHRASASEDDRLLLAHEMGRSIGPGSEDSMADGWSPIEYQLWNASNAGESTSLQVVMRSSDASGWSGNSYTLTSGGSQLSSDTLLSGMYDGSVSVAVNVGQELIFSLPNPGGTTSTISWDLQTTNADGTFTIYSVSSTDPDLIKFPTALTFTMPGLLIGSATLPSSVSGQVDLLPAYVGDDLLFSVLTGGSTDTMYIGWSLMEMDSSQIYSAQDAASDAVKFPFLINFTVAGPSACVQNTAREVSFYMDVYSTDMDFSMATFTKIFADESWLYLLPTASKLFRVDLMTISQVESLDVGGSSFTGGFTDGTYGYLVPNTASSSVTRFDLGLFDSTTTISASCCPGWTGGFHYFDGSTNYAFLIPMGGKLSMLNLDTSMEYRTSDLTTQDSRLYHFSDYFVDGDMCSLELRIQRLQPWVWWCVLIWRRQSHTQRAQSSWI